MSKALTIEHVTESQNGCKMSTKKKTHLEKPRGNYSSAYALC